VRRQARFQDPISSLEPSITLRSIGNVTFLFTDVEGSTRLWERDPEAMRAALARHDAIIESAVASNAGRVFKYVGDAVYAAFDDAVSAIRAAVAAQAALHAEPWPDAAPILVRMALHAGPAERIGEDYVGPTLNRCARLVDLGHGGQTLVSLAVREAAAGALPPDVSLLDLQTHRLRDLAQPEHVFQLDHPALPSSFPPVRSLDALPHNLPMRRSLFVGRQREMDEVKELLREHPLVTLTGTGGGGKTRLALQVAGDMAHRFPDGVWFVPLESLREPAIVPQQAVGALGIATQPGLAAVESLVEYLRPRDLLLVLDNCEHLVDACARLAAELLAACPRLRLLATSLEPLGVEGEKVWIVPPLDLPDVTGLIGRDDASALDYLTRFDAVKLFVARAEAASPGFALRPEDARAVFELIRQLDGLPLAIELAAARTPVMSVEQILARLDDRFGLLAAGRRDAVARHQALRSLIDWSHDLLEEPEKLLFRRLAVFRGGWTLSAAEQVCADKDLPAGDVAATMARLAAKSMVRVVDVGEGPRQQMLVTLHDYALELLDASPDAGSVRRALLAWAARVVTLGGPGPLAAPDEAWLQAIDIERDNLLAALSWSTRALHGSPMDEALARDALRLGACLEPYWDRTGQAAQGLLRLERLLEAAPDREATEERVWALIGAGRLACRQGNTILARVHAEEALGLAEPRADRLAEIGATQVLALSQQLQGCYAEARALHEACLSRQEAAGDDRGMAETLHHLGDLATEQGDAESARAAHERSLTLRRASDDRRGVASSLNALAGIAHRGGDLDSAYALYMESLQLGRDLGDRPLQAAVLGNLGWLAGLRGDAESALPLLHESLRLHREVGDRRGAALELLRIGDLALRSGRLDDAQRAMCDSLESRVALGDARGTAESLEACARLALAMHRPDWAARWLGAASATRESIQAPLGPHAAEALDQCAKAIAEAIGEAAHGAARESGALAGWRSVAREAVDALGGTAGPRTETPGAAAASAAS
jgi:predicted ATPase/class 3 adenylate cyclase